jgi:nucleoside-diphosphate-sugar epimerase
MKRLVLDLYACIGQPVIFRAGAAEPERGEGQGMRVLVLGGTGFIGSVLVRRLSTVGHTVAVFHRGQSHADLPRGVRQLLGDRDGLAENASDFRQFAPDVVVDLVAYNERQAEALVAAFRGLAGRVVVVSSGDVYRAYGRLLGTEAGPPEPVPLAEDAPLRQALFPYRTKAKGPGELAYNYEKILVERAVMGHADLRATVLRLPMVYGPGDKQHRLFPYIKRMDDSRRAILLDERLAAWRCPRGYVENIAAAIALAVTEERAAGRTYNVAEPDPFTEAEWVRQIGQVAGWNGDVIAIPPGRLPIPFHTAQPLILDSSRIRREVGYTEPVSLAEALRKTVAWERAHPPEQPMDYAAEDTLLAELKIPG